MKLNEKYVYYANVINHRLSKRLFYKKDDSYVLNVHTYLLISILKKRYKFLLKKVIDFMPYIFKYADSNLIKSLMLKSVLKYGMTVNKTTLYHLSSRTTRRHYFKTDHLIFDPIPYTTDERYPAYDFRYSLSMLTGKTFEHRYERTYYFCKPAEIKYNYSEYTFYKNFYKKEIDFMVCERLPSKINFFAFDIVISSAAVKRKVLDFLFDFANFKDNSIRDWPYTDFFYKIIVPEYENAKINWNQTIHEEIKRLKKLLKVYKTQNNQTQIKIISNAISLLRKLKIAQIPKSNSFYVVEIENDWTKYNQITFRGVYIIRFGQPYKRFGDEEIKMKFGYITLRFNTLYLAYGNWIRSKII